MFVLFINRIFGTWTTLVILTKSTVGYSFFFSYFFFHNSKNLDTEFDYNANLFSLVLGMGGQSVVHIERYHLKGNK